MIMDRMVITETGRAQASAGGGARDWLGSDWPHRDRSLFVRAAGLRWHCQVMGTGPAILLVHGTAASTHSWRDVAARLAERFTVVIPDLPGHGMSELPPARGLSMAAMADGLSGLLTVLGVTPHVVAGHSAGAAVLARMCLDGRIAPTALVSVNGALLPLPHMPGPLFSALAFALEKLPFVPMLMARRARDRDAVARLLADTGSRLDRHGIDLYARLLQRETHVAAALGMMARWDLATLARDLPRLGTKLILVVGTRDRTIAPHVAEGICRLVPGARIHRLDGLGHLAHEERPDEVSQIIADAATDGGSA